MSRAASELLAVERKLESARGEMDRAWLEVARLRQQAEEVGRAGRGPIAPPVRIVISVNVYGTIPGGSFTPPGTGLPQIPGSTVNIYLEPLGSLVGSGVTDAAGQATIVCEVDPVYVYSADGYFTFNCSVVAAPPAANSSRYVGNVTYSGSSNPGGPQPRPIYLQLQPATGYEFWLNGIPTPLKDGFTIVDSRVGTTTVNSGGSFYNTITFNFTGIVGGCPGAVGVEVEYSLPATYYGNPWNTPFVQVIYNGASASPYCPQSGSALNILGTFGGSLDLAPFQFVATSSDQISGTTPFSLYAPSGATITVTET